MARTKITQTPTTSKPRRKKSIRRMAKHNNGLLALPNEMLLMVAKNLTKFDQQCFALTCTYTTAVICQGKTNVIDGPGQSNDNTKEFFLRLQKGWVPRNLKWCHHCGKFQSRDKHYWDELAEKHKNKSGGLLNEAWAYLLKDGTVGELVENWCHPKALRMNSAIKVCLKCMMSMARQRRWGNWDLKH